MDEEPACYASEICELESLALMTEYCERQLTMLAPACSLLANLLRTAILAEVAARRPK
jgi:hypothetical protein